MEALGANTWKECLSCGITFLAKNSYLRRGQYKYCSRECYSDHKKASTPRPLNRQCLKCGRGFFSHPSRILSRDPKFCCKSCQIEFKKKTNPPPKICPVCNSFVFGRGQKYYCSKECAMVGGKAKRTVQVKCGSCGEMFGADLFAVQKGNGIYCSQKCFGRMRSQANREGAPAATHKRSNGGRREDLDNVYFRSSWEANYARYLNWLKSVGVIASWLYEPQVFEFPVKRGNTSYTPDFKVTSIDGSYSWHEVKGWMDAASKTKLKRMAKFYPSEEVIIIGKKEYYEIARAIKNALPGWESCPKKNI